MVGDLWLCGSFLCRCQGPHTQAVPVMAVIADQIDDHRSLSQISRKHQRTEYHT